MGGTKKMIYVIDTSSFNVLKNYYPEVFPTLWANLDKLIEKDRLISVKEALRECDDKIDSDHLQKWIKNNRSIFLTPSSKLETKFVEEIFSVPHFKYLVPAKYLLKSNPVADPFIVAAAKIRNGCVITEEKYKKGAAKIPNICEHFNVKWNNIQGLMKEENWNY